MGVSNTLGVMTGKMEGSSSIAVIASRASRAASVVRVCFLVAGRSHTDKAAVQARSLE
jgi:hypothetical protein